MHGAAVDAPLLEVRAPPLSIETRYVSDTYVEVWETKLYFYPSAGGFEKKKKRFPSTLLKRRRVGGAL